MSTKDYANALVQYKGTELALVADYISGKDKGVGTGWTSSSIPV